MSDNRCRKVTFFQFKYFICVCIMTYILSIHTVSARSTGIDDTTVASSNNSSESTGTNITTSDSIQIASSDSISESTATDGTALFNASEITSTDYITVASPANSPESTGSDSTTLYNTTEITGTDDTTVESTDSTGYFHSTTESPEKPQGANCSSATECTSNLTCASSKCDCVGDFYYDSSSRSCLAKKPQGANCNSTTECTSNLNCVSGICDCVGDFYYDSSSRSCLAKKPQGANCSSATECTSNLTCASSKCDCVGDFYYDSSSRSCLAKKLQGASCSSTTECISNLTCASSKCDCVGDFYYDSLSRSCLAKLDHGAVCRSSAECKGSSRNCTSYLPSSTNKCLCADGFYWTNYSSCISQNNLKITATNIRQTRTVIFVWHDMSQRSDVIYSIRWNGSNQMNAVKTGVTVTGLEPGTLYNFSVLTSLPGDGHYPPITVEQPQAPLWTRPDRPGPVSDVRREANSTYAITFGKSNGSVSLYTMGVSTGGSVIETQNNTSTVMYFTTLKPATTYIYVLESYNGNSEKSDSTTGNFTTGSEASGPVIAFSYREVQSHTANITWQSSSQPNGNITGYLVEVTLQNTAGCLYYIKVPCYDCGEAAPNVSAPCPLMVANITSYSHEYNVQLLNLTPYRNYTATVRAVNERGLGDQSFVIFQTDASAAYDILDLTVHSVRDENTLKINLHIVWTPGGQTGPTDYYILVQEATGLDATEHNQSISPLQVTGYSSTTYVKYDVLAYWNYTVSIWAQTGKGNSSQKSAQNRTVENYPGAVQNLNVAQDVTVANVITLTFECPEIRSRNGSIELFVITQTLLDQQEKEGKIPDIVYNQSASDGQSESCSSGYTVMAKNIMVERNYSFSVMTVNNKYAGGFNNVSIFYVQPKVPFLVSPQEMFQVEALVKQDRSAVEFTKIHADVCSSCLTDVRWGTVNDVGILVCAKGANCTVPGRKKRSTTQQFTQIPSWGSAKLQDFKIEYRTTPNKWVPATDGNNKYDPFVVGNNTSCSLAKAADYCNGPLPAGQEFYISVIMCTTAGCSVYREPYVFATQARKDDESPVGAIVGGVLGGLALIAVIAIIVCLIRKAQTRREIRESIRENPDTHVTRSDKHTPKQTFSGHIELPQLRENSGIYDEINDYDYIKEETVRHVRHSQPTRSRANNVGHSHPPRSLVNNVRSHRDAHQGIRESTELQFPYENEVSVNHDQDYIRYENHL